MTVFRKMRRIKQQISREECIRILKVEPRGVLSMLGDDGYPYGIPLNHWYCEEDGKLYFHGAKTGHKIDAITNYDKVSFCVYNEGYRNEGDWALNITSVVVFGRIRLVTEEDKARWIGTNICRKFTDDEEYLPPFYFSERGTAKRLTEIGRNSQGIHAYRRGLIERIREKTGMEYDEIQQRAILTAVQSKVLVLTGGPGTGKTTTTLGIITAFRAAGAKILLAAPTGRAAKRLSEATGMEAKTIHRLLEVKPPDGYQKNEEEPLEGDVLIVDECSMIDIMLMYNLLKAVPDTMTLILVGDIDQLPSVGAGNVLRDIIDSACFPVVRLTKIFRQAQTSRIIMNAPLPILTIDQAAGSIGMAVEEFKFILILIIRRLRFGGSFPGRSRLRIFCGV